MPVRVGIFFTHPIQYFSPLFRKLAAMPELDIVVHYFSDVSLRGGMDRGFGVEVKWDVPLLEGYPHVFVSKDRDVNDRASLRLDNPEQTLIDGKFDAVFFAGYMCGFERQLLDACWKKRVPVVIRGEFSDRPPVSDAGVKRPFLKQLFRDLYLRRFYKKVTRFCVVGADARTHLQRLGVKPERTVWSPYSIDDELLTRQAEQFPRDAARQELGIPENRIAVLFSGKFVPRKNPLLLIEAIARMRRVDQVHLLMLGDGDLRNEVAASCGRLLPGAHMLPGFVNQSQLGRYFSAADVFVLPSDFETWGLVVNEAMCFKLPVVTTNGVGSSSDLIEEGKTGWTFPVRDIDALAAVLDKAVALGVSGLAEMKSAIAERINRYSLADTASGVRDAILQSVSERRR